MFFHVPFLVVHNNLLMNDKNIFFFRIFITTEQHFPYPGSFFEPKYVYNNETSNYLESIESS